MVGRCSDSEREAVLAGPLLPRQRMRIDHGDSAALDHRQHRAILARMIRTEDELHTIGVNQPVDKLLSVYRVRIVVIVPRLQTIALSVHCDPALLV